MNRYVQEILRWPKQELDLAQLSQSTRLCCLGKTGCGKTYLAKQLAQHLSSTHIVYYFSNSFKYYSRPTVGIISYKFGAIHSEIYEDYKKMLDGLVKIKSQISNQSTALIFDELYFSGANELTAQLFAVLREYSYQDTIIFLSQSSKIISKHWKQYHKLFGCLTQREIEEIKVISCKYNQHPNWLEKVTNLPQNCWLLDELNQPLSDKILTNRSSKPKELR